MIRITCTHCRQILTIDDGFAGGVCRCQHCGTIQTVPAAAGKTQGRSAAPTARTLYRSQPRKGDDHGPDEYPHGSGSGLDELAHIVSSSGLAGNSRRLKQQVTGNGFPAAVSRNRRSLKIFALIGFIGLLVVVLIGWWISRSTDKTQSLPTPRPVAGNGASSTPIAVPAPVVGPNFAGLSIEAHDTVIYLLDDGGSAIDILPAMQAACYQSVKSLGKDRRFKIIFWRDGSPTYPADGTARATDEEESKCEAALHDTYAEGNPEIDAALKLAIENHADTIVLVTAKAAQLADDFTQTVLTIRGESPVNIYTIGVNGDSTIDPTKPGILAAIAGQTGGQFLAISSTDLGRFSH